MSEIVTPHKVESLAIHWGSAFIEKKGVVSVPCRAIIVGSDRNRYRLRFDGQIVTVQAEGNPFMAYVRGYRWSVPDAARPWCELDKAAFQNAAFRHLIGYGPNADLRFPIESADDYLDAIVSDDGARITAPSGWTVTVGFNPAHGWIKLTASLGGVTRCSVTGDGLTVSDIARLYKVPEGTRRNLVAAAGARWPEDPAPEEIN